MKHKRRLLERMADKLKRMNPRPAPLGVDAELWCMEHDCCQHGVSLNRVKPCEECQRELEVGILSGRICAECHGTGVVVGDLDLSRKLVSKLLVDRTNGAYEAVLPLICACDARHKFNYLVAELFRQDGKPLPAALISKYAKVTA